MAGEMGCEAAALRAVHERARASEAADRRALERLCGLAPAAQDELAERILTNRLVTLNFHPDRRTNNGRLVAENLLEQGEYLSQFATGMTNGGHTAYPGGQRDVWEDELFHGAYVGCPAQRRPKYGALNLHNYADGASPRFGSCHFALQPKVCQRCTFAFGDSSTGPQRLSVQGGFLPVLLALLEDVAATGQLLGMGAFSVASAVSLLLRDPGEAMHARRRDLDRCIETHVHGPMKLEADIAYLAVDESFADSDVAETLTALSSRYQFPLRWTPARRVPLADIGEAFRGPAVPLVARRAVEICGEGGVYIDAALIGRASLDTLDHPERWADLGTPQQLFQYIKQLWHTAAHFG